MNFLIVPKVARENALHSVSIEDGIHAARMLFGRCWFDAEKTAKGLEALQHYRWDYNSRLNEFKPTPIHDWSSHGADAFRGLAVRHYTPKATQRFGQPETKRDFDPADARLRRQAQRMTRGGW